MEYKNTYNELIDLGFQTREYNMIYFFRFKIQNKKLEPIESALLQWNNIILRVPRGKMVAKINLSYIS